MWLIILLVVLATFFYLTGVKPIKYWEARGIPTLKAWPYFGHIRPVVFQTRPMALILDDTYKAFPERRFVFIHVLLISNLTQISLISRYVGFYNMINPLLIIRDLELTKQIMIKEFDTFPEHRSFISEDADPLWSNNLFAMRGIHFHNHPFVK